jgi:purine-binding chemotaxis protein CheW
MADTKRIEHQIVKTTSNLEGKYLAFTLAQEEYAIAIRNVREIIRIMPITAVPSTPDFMKGLLNLRGKLIPVLDLRVKFGMEKIAFAERTCIIVVEAAGKDGLIIAGFAVDAVATVLTINAADLEEAPFFGLERTMGYIMALAKLNGGIKIIIDVDRVIGREGITDKRY